MKHLGIEATKKFNKIQENIKKINKELEDNPMLSEKETTSLLIRRDMLIEMKGKIWSKTN